MRRRVRVALLVAVAAFAADQASKLVAAAVEPAHYAHNATSLSAFWDLAVLAVSAAVLLVPFRPLAPAVGLWLGGASGNLLDSHVWPGGVPDFIRVGFVHGTFNLADIFIAAGAVGVGVLLLVWVAMSASAHTRRPRLGAGGPVDEESFRGARAPRVPPADPDRLEGDAPPFGLR